MQGTRKFWMVWNPTGRAPTHQHLTKGEATAESKRLAGINPDCLFYVLEAVGIAARIETTYVEINDAQLPRVGAIFDDLPF